MAYLTPSGPNDVGPFIAWAGIETPVPFRLGSTPAICNSVWQDQCGKSKRWYRQTWTTTWAARDDPTYVDPSQWPKEKNPNYKWDFDAADTSFDAKTGLHTYEITHNYDYKKGLFYKSGYVDPSGDYVSGFWQGDNPNYPDFDLAHRVVMSNYSESNCVAGCFLAHPDCLTRNNFDDLVKAGTVSPDFWTSDQGTGDDGFLSGHYIFRYLNAGNFIMRVQGMDESLGLYRNPTNQSAGFGGALTLTTSNPSAEAQDFSTGGFYMPVITLGDNPFWRADPTHWSGILESLKMDVMPYCVPTRKTRPVMYRFWDSEFSTAMYGGPVFHCAMAGRAEGQLSMANVPYYRKFLRDFMASDETIMNWRRSLGLKETEDARYPHNYVNYWKTVNALEGFCGDGHGNSIWADGTDQTTPTEWVSEHPTVHSPSQVGAFYEIDGSFTETAANHFVLAADTEGANFKLDLYVTGRDRTLVYPPEMRTNNKSKLSMNMKRKIHRVNMAHSHADAYGDFYATMFSSGTWQPEHLSHRIDTDTPGVISDKGVALITDFMKHISAGADIENVLPAGISELDKSAVSGWFNGALINLVIQSLEDVKLARITEFRKWMIENGKTLTTQQFKALQVWLKENYPNLEATAAGFFESLDRSLGEVDLDLINGASSFITAIGGAFGKTVLETGSIALMNALEAIKKSGGKISDIPIAIWNKIKDMMSKPAVQEFGRVTDDAVWNLFHFTRNFEADDGIIFVNGRNQEIIDEMEINARYTSIEKQMTVKTIQGLSKDELAAFIKDKYSQGITGTTKIVNMNNVRDVRTYTATTPDEMGKIFFNSDDGSTPDLPTGDLPLNPETAEKVKQSRILDKVLAQGQKEGKWTWGLNKGAEDAASTEPEAVAATVETQTLLEDAPIAMGAIESAEALTMASFAAEAAPLIILFAVTELLDYLAKQAEQDAERQAAIDAAHRAEYNFYEAHIPLNTDFFTQSEMTRLSSLHFFDPNDTVDTNPLSALLRAYEKANTDGGTTTPINWGWGTGGAPWVRFDFLTKLIVMNYMSLSMVNEDFLKNKEGLSANELVARIRQTEWLSTCETIRMLRIVDYSIRAPQWSDPPTVYDDDMFSPYHFPLTTVVPNGMIKEFMTPIPCLTPYDYPKSYDDSHRGLDKNQDLYGLIYGKTEAPNRILVPINIPADVDAYGNAIIPADAPATVAADFASRKIKGSVDQLILVETPEGLNVVQYYYIPNSDPTIAYSSPMKVAWDAIVDDMQTTYSVYGTLPTVTVIYKESKNPLTGLPMRVANIIEPVPVFAPDRSPTMFISSTDPTFAWPTLRISGGNMNYLAKELSYFDTHQIYLTGSDGDTIQPGKTYGSSTSRLVVSSVVTSSIDASSTVLVLTDTPEYSEALWNEVKRSLFIDDKANIIFFQAYIQTPPWSYIFVDDSNIYAVKKGPILVPPDNWMDLAKQELLKRGIIGAVVDANSVQLDGDGISYSYAANTVDWHKFNYPHPLRLISVNDTVVTVTSTDVANRELVLVDDAPIPTKVNPDGTETYPDDVIQMVMDDFNDRLFPKGAPANTYLVGGTDGAALRLVVNTVYHVVFYYYAVEHDYSVNDPVVVTNFKGMNLPGTITSVGYSTDDRNEEAMAVYTVKRQGISSMNLTHIIDFASTIDWVAFVDPVDGQDCGTLPPYRHIIVSPTPFKTDNFALFRTIIDNLNGENPPSPPPGLVGFVDFIKNLCIWKWDKTGPNGGIPITSTEIDNGVYYTTLTEGGTPTVNIQNMSALPVGLFTVKPLTYLTWLDPGGVWSGSLTSAFVLVLKGEVDDTGGSTSTFDAWKWALFYNSTTDTVGHVGRSLILNVPSSDTNLLVLDNPKRNTSPAMNKIKARFAQILSATAGKECYAIIRNFILNQFANEELKAPSKLQEDICEWLLRHVKVTLGSNDVPIITPSNVNRQIGLFHIGEKLSEPENFDKIYAASYSSHEFVKEHPEFKGTFELCDLDPYGPPTFPKGGIYFATVLHTRDGRTNPTEWAARSDRLAFNEVPETAELSSLLITLATEANNIGPNDEHIDDVINNNHTDLEALPKCKATASQHARLALVLHMAERVRRLRVSAITKARTLDEDNLLSSLQTAITTELSSAEIVESATKNFMTMLTNLDDIRRHRTVKSKSSLYTLSDHHAECAQACKETYKDVRSGMRTGTASYHYVNDISSPETAYFYNPHNGNLLVACRGTDVNKDLENGNIDESWVQNQARMAGEESRLTTLKRKFSAIINPASDLYTDFMIIVGRQSSTERLNSTLTDVTAVLTKYAVKSVTVTGHSLGGAIAMFVHQKIFEAGVKSNCVIFNGAVGLDETYFDLVQQTKRGISIPWANNLTTYHIGGESPSVFDNDPVSFLSGGIGKSEDSICVQGSGVPKRLKGHSISNFVTDKVSLITHETYTVPLKT